MFRRPDPAVTGAMHPEQLTFRRAPGTTGLYLRADNAQIWADTYGATWHARLPGSGGLGTDGLPVRERAFYTYAAAERWIESHD